MQICKNILHGAWVLISSRSLPIVINKETKAIITMFHCIHASAWFFPLQACLVNYMLGTLTVPPLQVIRLGSRLIPDLNSRCVFPVRI